MLIRIHIYQILEDWQLSLHNGTIENHQPLKQELSQKEVLNQIMDKIEVLVTLLKMF
jgi:glucosamine 6-phosphate synthetase-like amidotransferase/phosphosugar isomerase protein